MNIKAFFKIISIDDLIEMAKHNRNLITKYNRLLDNSGSANNYTTILDAIHYYQYIHDQIMNEISDRNTDENIFY